MKKSIISVILSFVTVLFTIPGAHAQKKAIYESRWYSGISAEDEESLVNRMQYDEKSKFLYLLSNDEKSLHIDLILADKAAIQKIMRFGLTTWFNPEGKHKKAMGIKFPVTPDGNDDQPMMRGKGADRKEMQTAMLASKNKKMILTGFGGEEKEKVIDPQLDPGYFGKVEMLEGGKLHISLALPLEKLGRDKIETAKNPFSVGFETGYLDVTGQGMPSGSGEQTGGGMHGGGGGMPGGGPPAGGPPGGGSQGSPGGANDQQPQQQPDINELARPSKLWISQVTLSEKP